MSRTTQYSEEFLRRTVLAEMSRMVGKEITLAANDSLMDCYFIPFADFDDDLAFELKCYVEHQLGIEFEWTELPVPCARTGNVKQDMEAFRAVTFEDLITFLWLRGRPPSFAPLDLPGVPGCEEAGVFLGVAELVRRIDHRQSRIAPSMAVGKVLRGSRLMQLWHRLGILSESAVPIPPAPRLIWGLYCYLFAAVMLMVGILGEIFQPGWGWLFSVGLLWGFKFFHIGRWLRESAVPLPPGVETWGDLARYLAPRWPGTHEIAR